MAELFFKKEKHLCWPGNYKYWSQNLFFISFWAQKKASVGTLLKFRYVLFNQTKHFARMHFQLDSQLK